MVVVIPLAETDEGDQPAVAAAVLRPMGLAANQMTEGVDRKGRVEHHEHPQQATHEEAADSPQERAVPPEPDAKGNHQAGDDDQPVVLVLPENHRVTAQPNFVFFETMRRLIEEPAAVAMPEPSGRIVGVFIRVRAGMMADVVCAPNQRRVLQRPSAGDQNQALYPIRAVKTLMCDQPVIADRDSHPRHDVHDGKVYPVKQRIADIVPIEAYADDRHANDCAEEHAGEVGKPCCRVWCDRIRLGHVSSGQQPQRGPPWQTGFGERVADAAL